MKTAQSPFEVSKVLAKLTPHFLKRVENAYRTAYSVSYSSGSGDHLNIKKTEHSDPTGDVTAEKERMRESVAHAGRLIAGARKDLDAADAILARVTEPMGDRVDNRIHSDDIDAGKRELHRRTRAG